MFGVDELLKATNGRLISGKIRTQIKGISIDSRTIKPNEAFIAIKGNNFNGHDFIKEAIKKGAKVIVHNRGLRINNESVTFIEVEDTIRSLGDIAKYRREQFDIPVIAVTGSNGKTTIKEMITWVLSKKFKVLKNIGTKNNQIGLPITLLGLDDSYDFAVVEMGTNHPGEIEYLARIAGPNIGIIANIGHSHLEYLKNLKGIVKEKCGLLKYLKEPCVAILNADDNLLKEGIRGKKRKLFIFWFGIKNRKEFFATDIKITNRKLEFFLKQKYKFTLKTLGYYNIYNALIAISVARIFGMEYKDIAERLSTFKFPQSRLELIELNNIKFIDDTYNSNPCSLKQALDVLYNFNSQGRKIFIMGDMLELGSRKKSFHRQAGQEVAKVCDVFITVGKLSKFTASVAESCGFDANNIFTCESTHQARDILFKKIYPSQDDIVLVKGSRAMKMEEVFRI